MRTRYQVDGRTVHFEVNHGSESVIVELSRASLCAGLTIRDSRARAIAAGSGSSSSSRAKTGAAVATAAAAGRRYGCKLSE
jgi:hypothetical protein